MNTLWVFVTREGDRSWLTTKPETEFWRWADADGECRALILNPAAPQGDLDLLSEEGRLCFWVHVGGRSALAQGPAEIRAALATRLTGHHVEDHSFAAFSVQDQLRDWSAQVMRTLERYRNGEPYDDGDEQRLTAAWRQARNHLDVVLTSDRCLHVLFPLFVELQTFGAAGHGGPAQPLPDADWVRKYNVALNEQAFQTALGQTLTKRDDLEEALLAVIKAFLGQTSPGENDSERFKAAYVEILRRGYEDRS